jgi:hypothetical protein
VRTIRIVDTGLPIFPFAWSGPAAATTPVTAFVVASAAAMAATSPLSLDPETLLWAPGNTAAYTSAAETLLEQAGGTRWLRESALPGILFQGLSVQSQVTLPAVVADYFELAANYGDAAGDPAACAASTEATQNDAGVFASPCPPGALGVVPGPSPCAPVGAEGDAGVEGGTIASDDGGEDAGNASVEGGESLGECGGTADDAALALASLATSGAWVTRMAGLLETKNTSDVAVSVETGPAISPIVVAGGTTVACTAAQVASLPPAPSNNLGQVAPSTTSYPPTSGASGSTAPAVSSTVADGCGSAAGAGASSDSCSNDDPSSDGTDDAGSGCGSPDTSGDNCAAAGRTRTGGRSGRSPFSRIVVAMATVVALARRRRRRRGAIAPPLEARHGQVSSQEPAA